jgi:hypothetical protein
MGFTMGGMEVAYLSCVINVWLTYNKHQRQMAQSEGTENPTTPSPAVDFNSIIEFTLNISIHSLCGDQGIRIVPL